MMATDKLYPDYFWDIKKILIVQDSFNVVSIFEALNHDFLGLIVLILEFL